MRYLTLVALFAMLVVCRPLKSSAAAMDDDDYPRGSYRQTCRDISLRGDDLRARCQDTRGHFHDAFLDGADRCWGDISNNNGHLVCNKNGTLPGGGYNQTCREVRVRYNVLRARCQDRDGQWVDTSLESFATCRSAIENINGQLRCMDNRGDHDRDWDRDRDRDRDHDGDRDRDRDRGYGPRGSYSQSCRDIRTHGNSLRAVCQTMRGDWVETSLNGLNQCVGDIVNDDGRLECTRRGGRLVPVGSYSQSCRNVYVRGDNLRAMCQNRGGQWVWSELHDWDDCRGGIQNDDGRLRCNRY
jgi:CVNH domain-containing protein